mgnify:CR=1 FL=1
MVIRNDDEETATVHVKLSLLLSLKRVERQGLALGSLLVCLGAANKTTHPHKKVRARLGKEAQEEEGRRSQAGRAGRVWSLQRACRVRLCGGTNTIKLPLNGP